MKGYNMNTRPAFIVATLLALTGLIGCEKGPRGGGATDADSFRLVVPDSPIVMKQGAVQTVEVSLVRGDYFKQDVRLTLRSSPGLNVDPSTTVIRASERPLAQIKLGVGRDVALGEYRVTVTAAPVAGENTLADFRVNVIAP